MKPTVLVSDRLRLTTGVRFAIVQKLKTTAEAI